MYERRGDDWKGIKVVFLERSEVSFDSSLANLSISYALPARHRHTAKKTTALTITSHQLYHFSRIMGHTEFPESFHD